MRTLFFALLFLPLFAVAQDSPVLQGIWYTPGNRITHLRTGQELDEARRVLLESATDSIYVSVFSISADDSGLGLYKTLCEKARAGLDVRVIVDHHNNKNIFEHSQKLKECGAYVLSFRPGNRWFAHHEKILVVDGEKMILGGSGFSTKYALAAPASYEETSLLRQVRAEGWYDTDYLIEGPASCRLMAQYKVNFTQIAKSFSEYNPDYWWYGIENFRQMIPSYYGFKKFRGCRSTRSMGNERVTVIQNNPHRTSADHRPILQAHLAAVNQAKEGEEFQLYAPYFVPNAKLVKAMEQALKRGVKITVITNSMESNDEKSFARKIFIGMMEATEPLIKAGMKIYLWNQTSTVHRKGGRLGRVAFWGSDNLDNRAQDYQSEVVAYTDSVSVVEGVSQDFLRDLQLSVPLSKEYVDKAFDGASFLDKLVGTRLKRYL